MTSLKAIIELMQRLDKRKMTGAVTVHADTDWLNVYSALQGLEMELEQRLTNIEFNAKRFPPIYIIEREEEISLIKELLGKSCVQTKKVNP